jgi:hypothetical protein
MNDNKERRRLDDVRIVELQALVHEGANANRGLKRKLEELQQLHALAVHNLVYSDTSSLDMFYKIRLEFVYRLKRIPVACDSEEEMNFRDNLEIRMEDFSPATASFRQYTARVFQATSHTDGAIASITAYPRARTAETTLTTPIDYPHALRMLQSCYMMKSFGESCAYTGLRVSVYPPPPLPLPSSSAILVGLAEGCPPDVWPILSLIATNIGRFLTPRAEEVGATDGVWGQVHTNPMSPYVTESARVNLYDSDFLDLFPKWNWQHPIAHVMELLVYFFERVFTFDVDLWVQDASSSSSSTVSVGGGGALASRYCADQIAVLLRLVVDEQQLVVLANYVRHNYHALISDFVCGLYSIRNKFVFGLGTLQVRNRFVSNLAPEKYYGKGISLFDVAAIVVHERVAFTRAVLLVDAYRKRRAQDEDEQELVPSASLPVLPDNVWSLISELAREDVECPPSVAMYHRP